MPSAAARHVLAICGAYLISVSLLLATDRLGGHSTSSGLIQFAIVAAGLVAITVLVRAPFGRDGRDRGGPAEASTDDHRPGPSNQEFADAAQHPRTGNGMDLRETDRQLGELDRALEVGVVVTDDEGRPQVVGERARHLLGLNASKPPDTDGALEAMEELIETAARTASTGETTVASVPVSSSRGRGHLEATAVPAEGNDDGNVVVQLRNLEHVRSLRRNLLDAARQRVLTRLYLGVAHDLRAPINAIVLNLANLKDSLLEYDEDSGREHHQTIEMVEDELLRLQRAVESLLGQTAPLGTEASTFDLRELLGELEFLLSAQARQQRLEFEVAVPTEPALVTAPRDSIKQAILNVVVNAFDAAADRRRVVVEVITEPKWVEVIVSDSGDGILESIVPRLFEMHATTKESGSGIGLFVARSAVEAADGSLRLVRTGPDGTVFSIRLPSAEGDWVGQET